jgi:hypothetical protein
VTLMIALRSGGLSDVVIDEFVSETEVVSDFFALRHF